MKKLPPYYQKYRWMVDVTQNPNHPDYALYGAKGIDCHWGVGDYKAFYSWLIGTLGHQPTPNHQLSRKDKFKGWHPGNLEWMLPKQRSRSHTKQNIFVKYKNKSQSMSQWADDLDIPFYTFRRRIAKGIPIKDIVKEFKNVKTKTV